MTAERQRRYMAKLKARAQAGGNAARLQAELASARERIAELERQLAARREQPRSGLVRNRRRLSPDDGPETLAELDALRARATAERQAERAQRAAATAAGEGEVFKLRQQIAQLKGEIRLLKLERRQIAKQRDRLGDIHKSKVLREANRGKLARDTFNKIVHCLHADTRERASEAQRDDACRLFIELRPLFQFDADGLAPR
jgi:hypothetical protein